jgi:hypothetical protein
LALASKIYEVVEQHGLDLVHAHYAIPTPRQRIWRSKWPSNHRKIITTLHGTTLSSSASILPTAVYPLQHRTGDGVTAVSQYLADLTRQELTAKAVEVIPICRSYVFRGGPIRSGVSSSPSRREDRLPYLELPQLKRVPLIIQMFREWPRGSCQAPAGWQWS